MNKRNHGTLAVLTALPLALTLFLSGCGSDGGGDGVASANEGKKKNASASPSLSRDELNVKYAQCLRKHGLDVEDPKPGEGVQLSVDGDDKGKADKAMEACREFAGAPPSDEENAKERADMLEFAKCMRKNGVESFADPKPGEGVNIGPEQGEDPDFEAASKVCDEGQGDNKKVESSQ